MNTTKNLILCGTVFVLLTPQAHAQLILNEANAVGVSASNNYLQDGEVYEGYDYGTVIPYSGNTNSPLDPTDPGNPFPADVDSATSGNQTTLPNGWTGTTGWARIQENGGDWIELVVTEDNTDLRGYTLYWENIDVSSSAGEGPDDRGAIKFTTDPVFSNLRAGTIITISEESSVDEIRDDYPFAPPFSGEADTLHDYDLSTDTSFDPLMNDWHMHFHLNEALTDAGTATQYFEAFSDIKVDNDDWGMAIFDATNTTLTPEVVESPGARSTLDLTTGLVQGFVGEDYSNWGDNTDAGSVNNQEMVTLTADPTTGASIADYEDVDFSTFGSPNLFNESVESTLDGVQDFSALRGPVFDDLLTKWRENFGESLTDYNLGDFDGNGIVDGADFLKFQRGLDSGIPVLATIASVPEPSTLFLVGSLALVLVGSRSRKCKR